MKSQSLTVPRARPAQTRWVQRRKKSKTTKALNSWIGFRFYKKIFPKMQQKKASTLLTKLWNRDPFKAKWSIISAVYSKIRDAVTKEKAPIVTFLDLVCPHIGILSVEEYLIRLSWTSYTDETGALGFKQLSAPNLSELPDNIINTTVTGEDLIRLCADKGYIQHKTADELNNPNIFIAFGGVPNSRQNLINSTTISTRNTPECTSDPVQTPSNEKIDVEPINGSLRLRLAEGPSSNYVTEFYDYGLDVDSYLENFLNEQNFEFESVSIRGDRFS
uniref:MAT1-1-1 n=1 Tax=Podosphaera macularis TaxID=683375 RepID=A0A088FY05_9PEZI|nr:MAT1-1-1 [Podosphaera macularis]